MNHAKRIMRIPNTSGFRPVRAHRDLRVMQLRHQLSRDKPMLGDRPVAELQQRVARHFLDISIYTARGPRALDIGGGSKAPALHPRLSHADTAVLGPAPAPGRAVRMRPYHPQRLENVRASMRFPRLAGDPLKDIGREDDTPAAVLEPCPWWRGDRHGSEFGDDPLSRRRHLWRPLLICRKAAAVERAGCRNVTNCWACGSLSRRSGRYLTTGVSRSTFR